MQYVIVSIFWWTCVAQECLVLIFSHFHFFSERFLALVLKAAADLIPDGPAHKKQRMSDLGGGGTPTSAVAAFRSSPVPDSDT